MSFFITFCEAPRTATGLLRAIIERDFVDVVLDLRLVRVVRIGGAGLAPLIGVDGLGANKRAGHCCPGSRRHSTGHIEGRPRRAAGGSGRPGVVPGQDAARRVEDLKEPVVGEVGDEILN